MRTMRLASVAVMLLLGSGTAIAEASPQTVSETAQAGDYSLTLKVLPAEAFTGEKAEMAWDGGAAALPLTAAAAPDHHMVVFVKRAGKPVENASVEIRYRRLGAGESTWIELPVARMHVAGKPLTTTHYGNNVRLAVGRYAVEVRVGDSPPATFDFTLAAR
jgi:hypothetical protein